MPKITKSAQEQSTDSPIDQVISSLAGEITVSTNPVFICGVNRKVNIGNFENVDIMACLTVPMNGVDPSNGEDFSNAIKEAASEAFSLVSRATGERYQLIQESQQTR
mgnify:CR=1 FL=1